VSSGSTGGNDPKLGIPHVGQIEDVQLRPFRVGSGATQRIHDADARVYLAGAVIVLFLIVFGLEMYGCLGKNYCTNLQMVKDTIEPFAGACFTALGAAIAFYFADRSKS
jgi:hypothetical protein